MSRFFSVYRRRPGVVDIFARRTDPTWTGFRVRWADNFDAATTDIIDAPFATGFVDSAVPRNSIESQPTNDTRIVFDPTTYTIPTDRTWWLQVVPLVGAVEQTPSGMTMIIPDRRAAGNYTQMLNGDLTTTAVQLDFYTIEDIRLVNSDTTNSILVASEPGGATVEVQPGTNLYLPRDGAFGSLYLSSSAGTVTMSGVVTLAIPR